LKPLIASTLAAVLTLGAGSVHRAAAQTIVVNPGESIQAAVDAAPAGAVIELRAGTFEEAVVLTKSGLTLRGAGMDATILDVGGLSAERGIYAEGVDNLTIEDLTVRGFPVDEILIGNRDVEGSGGRGHVIRRTRTEGAGSYGIGIFQATDTVLANNEVTDDEIGLYIGRSTDCNCDIVNNHVYDNLSLGILAAVVGGITIRDNDVVGNNSGIFVLQAFAGVVVSGNRVHGNSQGVQIGATPGVRVYRNVIEGNNRPSTEPADHPAGYGVALWGAWNARVVRNRITGHSAAGIEARAQSDWLGGTTSHDNNLCHNVLAGNAVDLVVDAASTGNGTRCINLPLAGNRAPLRAR
jgi:nitrous oxidase accessory protein NosD